MATRKQERTMDIMVADGSISARKALQLAGYSKAVQHQPHKVLKSDGFIDLARKYLPDKKLLDVATKGLDATKVIRYKGQEFTDPDYYARHQYLETALRIRNLIQTDDIPLGDVTVNIVNYADAKTVPKADSPINIKAQVVSSKEEGGEGSKPA